MAGRSSSILLLLASAFLVGAVLGLALVSLPLAVNEQTRSPFLVGLVVSLPFLADATMGFAWGGLSDRMGSRRVPVAVGLTVGGLLFFPLALVFSQFGVFVVLRAVQVLFLSASVLGIALITEFRPEERGRGTSEILGAGALGVLAGTPAGVLLQTAGGMTPVFVASGIASLGAAALVAAVREPRKASSHVGLREVIEVASLPPLRALLVVVLLLYVANAMGFPVALLALADAGFPRESIGVFAALLIVSGVALIIPLGRFMDRHGRRPVLRLAPVLYAVHWGGLAVVTAPWGIAALFASPVWPLLLAPAAATASDVTGVDRRGRAMASVNAIIAVGNTVGSVLGGAVLEASGRSYSLTFAATLVFIGLGGVAVFFVPESLSKRALPSTGDGPGTGGAT